MKRLFILFVLLAVGFSLSGQNLPQRPNPPRLVNDMAGVMSPAQVSRLESKLVEFDRRTSNQITVVTISDLDGMAPSDFAQRLHDKWGVGSAKNNNGILILVKPKVGSSRGEAFISVGYGLEGAIPDITAGRIIDNEMLPYFRQNEYYAGIDKSVDVLMKLSEGEFSSAEYNKQEQKAPMLFGLIVFIIFIVIMLLGLRSKKNHDDGSHGGSRGGWIPPIIPGGRGFGSTGTFGGGSSGGGFGGFGGFGGGRSGGGGGGRSWIVAFLIAFSFALGSCEKIEDPVWNEGTENTKPSEPVSRTVLAYMMADNNLSTDIYDNVRQMASGMATVNGGNMIVYFDGRGTNPQLLKLESDGSIKVIVEYDEENSASSETLTRIVNFVIEKYPAESYGLIFSSHGMGWLPSAGPTSMAKLKSFSIPRSPWLNPDPGSMWYVDPAAPQTKWLGQDGNDYMDVARLASALPQDRTFDFILFDACFMSGIEALYDMRNTAEYFIASPTEIMGYGFSYKTITPLMFDPESRWELICKDFIKFYTSYTFPSASVALVKAAELDNLAIYTKRVMDTHQGAAVDINELQYYERLRTHIFFDFDNYIRELTSGDQAVYNAFREQLAKTILYADSTPNVYSVYSGGGYFSVDAAKFCGVSAYVPHSGQEYNYDYYATAWAKAIGAVQQ